MGENIYVRAVFILRMEVSFIMETNYIYKKIIETKNQKPN